MNTDLSNEQLPEINLNKPSTTPRIIIERGEDSKYGPQGNSSRTIDSKFNENMEGEVVGILYSAVDENHPGALNGTRMTVKELKGVNLAGMPLWIDHDPDHGKVGEIVSNWLDGKKLYIRAKIFTRERIGPKARFVRKLLSSGELSQLSISLWSEINPITKEIVDRHFIEGSLVGKGHYDGTEIVYQKLSAEGSRSNPNIFLGRFNVQGAETIYIQQDPVHKKQVFNLTGANKFQTISDLAKHFDRVLQQNRRRSTLKQHKTKNLIKKMAETPSNTVANTQPQETSTTTNNQQPPVNQQQTSNQQTNNNNNPQQQGDIAGMMKVAEQMKTQQEQIKALKQQLKQTEKAAKTLQEEKTNRYIEDNKESATKMIELVDGYEKLSPEKKKETKEVIEALCRDPEVGKIWDTFVLCNNINSEKIEFAKQQASQEERKLILTEAAHAIKTVNKGQSTVDTRFNVGVETRSEKRSPVNSQLHKARSIFGTTSIFGNTTSDPIITTTTKPMNANEDSQPRGTKRKRIVLTEQASAGPVRKKQKMDPLVADLREKYPLLFQGGDQQIQQLIEQRINGPGTLLEPGDGTFGGEGTAFKNINLSEMRERGAAAGMFN